MKISQLIAACVAFGVTPVSYAIAGAGPTAQYLDHYEVHQSIDCNNSFNCALTFTKGAPTNKYFLLEDINCYIRTNKIVNDVRLDIAPANSDSGGNRSRWLLPGRYESTGTQYISNINEKVNILLWPGFRPKVVLSTTGQDNFTIACSMSGTLK